MANRLALDMGLNLDGETLIESQCITLEEIELRRQIFWALYCDDKLSAAYTGRVCTMLVRCLFDLFALHTFIIPTGLTFETSAGNST